jgi:hypothetical protein
MTWLRLLAITAPTDLRAHVDLSDHTFAVVIMVLWNEGLI